ncbi:hypothetical protein [Fulvivirga sedimenti]|uniref:6-phosphogluconate dehydrogenase n=1 Tax=Fulvivirga sedimenti TaxID=2879465 RepID=A0A9X1HMX0_9BACT|nr:hypothetical protein [Fulvivirga sedimenti]MCA6074796.1 hypothetical protein [Fulvivirga sedimenti]MCA6075973.1 hypothetical protein [Fulvivirga sedimenti]MCA6077101.1 hypothetical protein [Fulvivirga sedimenti]
MELIKKIIRWTFVSLGILGLLIFLFLYFANYSDGYRAGTPIKVSRKGTIFKTWEGEMNIGGLTSSGDGVIPTTWEFTVRDGQSQVREDIDRAIENGKRVKLYYKEKYVRMFWLGDTKYFVYKVEEIL